MGKYDLTEEILYILIDAATRGEDDPDYELQEEERTSYEATLVLIEKARQEEIA
jgi:hypothetical protein